MKGRDTALDTAAKAFVKAAFWLPLGLCAVVAFTADPTGVAASLSGVVAHGAAFAYLAVALFAAHFRSGAVLPVVLWLLAFGVMIEVGQTFVPGRTGELPDVVVDAVGIAAGCIVYRAWARPRRIAADA